MTYVIVEWCRTPKPPEKGGKPGDSTCYTNCVSVCPVDCIYPPQNLVPKNGTGLTDDDKKKIRDAKEMLYINPDECIDCGACEPECPVQAIFQEQDTPADMKHFVQINKDRSKK